MMVGEEKMVVVGTYILLNVLLAGIDSSLPNLEAHLGRVVVHETPKGRVHIASTWLALRRRLRGIGGGASGVAILTVGGGGRGRRAQLRHRRDVLGDGVVQRRRAVGVGRSLHAWQCLSLTVSVSVSASESVYGGE